MRALPKSTFLALSLAIGLPVAHARAEDAASSAAAGSSAEPLRVRFDLGDSELDPAALESDIERELRKPVQIVTGAVAPLSIRVRDKNRLTLEYQDPRSGRLERSVDLPAEPKRASEVVALLVGNMVRDEAAELLRTLEPPPASDAIAPEPAPAPADPAPAPEPAKTPAPAVPRASTPPKNARGWLGLRSRFDELTDGPVKVNASLFYPAALLRDSDRRVLNLEVGLFYSRVGAIEGVGVNLGAMIVQQHVRGVSAGSLWQHVGGYTRGVTASLIYDGGKGPLTGVSVGGVVAHRPAEIDGVQAATLVTSAGLVQGAQVSGAVNLSKSIDGVAASGGMNVVSGPVRGVVVSGAGNVMTSLRGLSAAGGANVTGDVHGATIAGGVNFSDRVRGLSIGIVNVADRVDGIQLGVVNVAREVHGASLGVVSIAGNGRIQPTLWTSNLMPVHLGLRFIAGYVYSEVGGAANPGDDLQALEAGGGLHLPLSTRLYLEPGVHYSEVQSTRNIDADEHGDLHYRLRGGVRLFDAFDVFGGGGVVQRLSGSGGKDVQYEALFGIAAL